MAVKLTRDNFQDLLTPIHRKIIEDTLYTEKPEQYSKIVKVDTMRKKEETFPHEGAFGLWEENTEGNTINEDTMSEGDTATLTAIRFDKGYSVTFELTRDDLYGVINGRGVKGSAQGLGRGLRAKIETDNADVINDGFGNTGYDGEALFANSHPLVDSASTCDNLLTGGLTPANLKTGLTLVRNQVNEANIKIQAVAKQLIVGPDLEYTAKEVTMSTNQAFEQSNTKNVVQGLQAIVMDYITGDTWVLRDPSFFNLTHRWRDKPFFGSQKLPKTVDFFVYGYTRYAVGYVDWRGLAGSQGA